MTTATMQRLRDLIRQAQANQDTNTFWHRDQHGNIDGYAYVVR